MRAPKAWQAILLAAIALPLCLEGELLPIRAYTTADGLAADHIDCIVPDSRGFVWFCTPEGLTRFDGYRMVGFGTREGLPDRAVETFLETRSGAYLAGTEHGLSQFHSRASGDRFLTYRQGAGRFDKPIYALLESPSGRIWCGTSGGLFEVLSASGFRPQPLPGLDRLAITDIKEDAGGDLWVATNGGIYVLGKDGAVQFIAKEDGLPNEWVNALLLDRAGRIWAGTRGGLAVMRHADAAGKHGVQRVFRSDGLAELNVMALAQAPDGAIWMGTLAGISVLPGGGDPVFRSLTRIHGLSDRAIVALAADKAGNMWAGTEGAGVMRIASAGFITFREQDGLPSDRVFSVFGDRAGTLLAVTQSAAPSRRSLNVFDPVNLNFHAVTPKVFGDKASWGQHQILLQARTGEWWAATSVGLCRFGPMSAADLAGRQPVACYAQDVRVFLAFEDSAGGIWASAQSAQGDRLLRWDPARKAISWFEDGPTRHELVMAFAEDRNGNIWMGLSRGGLFRYDGRQFTRFSRSDGVPAGVIDALLVDHRGRLWMGSTGGGIGLLENPGSAQFRVHTYDIASGLASNTILCIVEDDMGRIYAGTGKGVDRLEPATGRTKHFSFADGLAHGTFRSAFRDGSGNLWFATTQGLSRLTPTADQAPTIPTVLITDLQTGGERYPVSQAGETLIRPPRLDPPRNQLQVTFVGFNNEPAEGLRYKYKLEGTDEAWHDTREHTVNYAALEPGGYHFLVKAVNSEDRESTAPAEIDFEVLPPFWRRWWFEDLAVAGLASLVLAAHGYRVAQAVKLERMRTAIATDLHDDIGASLSQIAVLSEVARVDSSLGPSQPNDRLDRVATLARELADSMGDVVWSIRAEPESVDSLIRRMREFAGDLLESQGIGFALRVPEKRPHLQLSLHARRQLLLIFKECIHNAARHSRCTAVVAEFEVASQEIMLRVRDNGRGIESIGGEPGRNGGNGIPSMKKRAESLGGRMEWMASPGGGCTVAVHLPVRHGAFGRPAL
ncbi:MAG TPA: two-component regulator propeller domain-containing protein [Bryobacteraceae bacterium]|nr:two-component regulator propeller domain-containing protein [Bryobacteraceae bacterium]